MTHWIPDTDDCVIEISDDPATRGQFVQFVKGSKVHSTPQAVADENRTKNQALDDITKNGGSIQSWSIHNQTRVITVALNNVAATKTQISSQIASKYPGVVIV